MVYEPSTTGADCVDIVNRIQKSVTGTGNGITVLYGTGLVAYVAVNQYVLYSICH